MFTSTRTAIATMKDHRLNHQKSDE
jgi:hypothetical protein